MPKVSNLEVMQSLYQRPTMPQAIARMLRDCIIWAENNKKPPQWIDEVMSQVRYDLERERKEMAVASKGGPDPT